MRGVDLKTLFVYCSDDDAVNVLCNESALKNRDTCAFELACRKGKNAFSRYLGVNKNRSCVYSDAYAVDVAEYDKLIFACGEFMGEIPAELISFISKCDLRYKDIDCIVFGDGRNARRATDAVKVCVSLSGGTVRNAVSVSVRELKRESEDVLFSIRHRLAV